MRIGGLGPTELLLIVLIILLLFGSSKLADIGSSLGRGIREFRKAVQEDDKSAVEQPEKPASSN